MGARVRYASETGSCTLYVRITNGRDSCKFKHIFFLISKDYILSLDMSRLYLLCTSSSVNALLYPLEDIF